MCTSFVCAGVLYRWTRVASYNLNTAGASVPCKSRFSHPISMHIMAGLRKVKAEDCWSATAAHAGPGDSSTPTVSQTELRMR